MATETKYENMAFISYKHSRRDIRFAKWLQRKLERYHVPVRLQKERRLPKRIAPIVRDQSDLAGGRLEEMIHEKLGQWCNILSPTHCWTQSKIRCCCTMSTLIIPR